MIFTLQIEDYNSRNVKGDPVHTYLNRKKNAVPQVKPLPSSFLSSVVPEIKIIENKITKKMYYSCIYHFIYSLKWKRATRYMYEELENKELGLFVLRDNIVNMLFSSHKYNYSVIYSALRSTKSAKLLKTILCSISKSNIHERQ